MEKDEVKMKNLTSSSFNLFLWNVFVVNFAALNVNNIKITLIFFTILLVKILVGEVKMLLLTLHFISFTCISINYAMLLNVGNSYCCSLMMLFLWQAR